MGRQGCFSCCWNVRPGFAKQGVAGSQVAEPGIEASKQVGRGLQELVLAQKTQATLRRLQTSFSVGNTFKIFCLQDPTRLSVGGECTCT